MTQEQEIRAKALEIAILNHGHRFFNIRGGTIEFNDRHRAYLKAIENYISGKTCTEIPDTGVPVMNEVKP